MNIVPRYLSILLILAWASIISSAAANDQIGDLISSNYTLNIFGNANQDKDIDHFDVSYVEGVINGTNAPTNLSDANYDGKIDSSDIDRINEIITGEEKELIVIDSADRIVTIKIPVERVATLNDYAVEVMRVLDVPDKIVGVEGGVLDSKLYFPQFALLPSIGTISAPDFESMIGLHPDLMIQWTSKVQENAEKLPGIPVIGLDFYKPDTVIQELKMCGYIFKNTDRAEQFINWYDGWLNKIQDATKKISDEDRPRIFLEATYREGDKWKTGGSKSGWHQKIEIAGGRNLFGDIEQGSSVEVDPEEVMKRNPEIIVKRAITDESGYALDNSTEFAEMRDEIMSRPELSHVDAVEDGRVYIVHIDIFGGFNHIPGIAYLAKWFHPDLFKDLDPQAIHQEYLTRFQGLDYDLSKHGLFVYPETEAVKS